MRRNHARGAVVEPSTPGLNGARGPRSWFVWQTCTLGKGLMSTARNLTRTARASASPGLAPHPISEYPHGLGSRPWQIFPLSFKVKSATVRSRAEKLFIAPFGLAGCDLMRPGFRVPWDPRRLTWRLVCFPVFVCATSSPRRAVYGDSTVE